MEPKIIPRKEHCISRKQISPNALYILYQLHRKGFIAYLVGGCVRDLLLGRIPKDFDIATNATPGQIKRLFRNCRLIGRRFRLAHLHFKEETIEVSTFRRSINTNQTSVVEESVDSKQTRYHIKDENGMVLRDNLFGTPEDDALCRDFTINALAYNIADFSIVDYCNGIIDLNQRLIRTIRDPHMRFKEDPVRMLRAIRFSASHNLVIDSAVWENICKLSYSISNVSPARLFEEIQKLFLFGFSKTVFHLLYKSSLFTALFPDLSQWINRSRNNLNLIYNNLDRLDKLYQNGKASSVVLFFSFLLGPYIEDNALSKHRDSVSYKQALENVCNEILKSVCETVTLPKRVCNMIHGVLSLQQSLRRVPPKHPDSMIVRPEFSDAILYMRLKAENSDEKNEHLQWWDEYLNQKQASSSIEQLSNKAQKKRRKNRCRKNRKKTFKNNLQ